MSEKVRWVNQGATYDLARTQGYLWAPIRDARGAESLYRQMMTQVRKGDIIVHCAMGAIRAISRATSEAYLSPRPQGFPPPTESERRDRDAASNGRRIDVELFELQQPIPVSKVARKIAGLYISDGPLDKNQKPKQSYLHRFSINGLRILREAYSGPWATWAEEVTTQNRQV